MDDVLPPAVAAEVSRLPESRGVHRVGVRLICGASWSANSNPLITAANAAS